MRKSSKGGKGSPKQEQAPGDLSPFPYSQNCEFLFCCPIIGVLTNTISLDAATEAVDDVKVKAVNEMMERIKHGVVLRPVKSQDTKVGKNSEFYWLSL